MPNHFISSAVGITCPRCERPLVIKWGRNGRFLACNGYPFCRFTSEYERSKSGKIKMVEQILSNSLCDHCGQRMMVKYGRFGRFLACSRYPKCKYSKALTTGIACPKCKKGHLAEKQTRFGKIFFSCNRYPNCKYAVWDKPVTDKHCPRCQNPFLVEKQSKEGQVSLECPKKKCTYQKR